MGKKGWLPMFIYGHSPFARTGWQGQFFRNSPIHKLGYMPVLQASAKWHFHFFFFSDSAISKNLQIDLKDGAPHLRNDSSDRPVM